METINIKAFPKDKTQIEVIQTFFKDLKIKFEISDESQYDNEFVAMIKRGEKEIKDGKGISMSSEEFKSLCK